ncbi:hypothetical protein ACSBR2_017764 [Camellia fascicularis]
MLNTDLEVNGTFPPVVDAFRQKIREADGVLFASPEYNYSVTAPLKNAIDWASRPPNVWADKAAAIPEFFLNAFQAPPKFDSDGNLIDMATKEKLKEVLLSLQAFTLRLQSKC